ncbi:serine/threonine-protein kinase GRIK2-like isoform X2 [Tripterygium wilfordii]|uniref:serine/threonine-protein kinase GRIK2-like isoform X2 n=1 Tax=Tripterygium wilfordii TaxID=458696 RepID=UPI0018F80577|nr:serine/threonine-protein kinase GRIK2-like isoform X2 [Tripterygium wilfordii]
MLSKSYTFKRLMGCCNCFGFTRKPKRRPRPISVANCQLSQELLLDEEIDDEDDGSYNDDITDTAHGDVDADDSEVPSRLGRSEEILKFREQNGFICRQFPVKETHKVVRTEDENGNKVVNEYVREYKIGAGSYGKVVLYQSRVDGKHYAIKVLIMKMLNHPNIVNLIEVIDDPSADHFYMVLEYVDGKWACEGCGPPGGIGEDTARKYLRDIVAGLIYLHAHNIVHGDIKPDNLLVTRTGTVKIGDFSVSQVFEDDNDELRRSPGTPVFTAPECCLGLTYHGKAADTWAVGVSLYCMIVGQYPFLGETLQDTYDKIVNNSLILPDEINPQLKNLLEGLLSKDPNQRLTLDEVAQHTWIIGADGPIPQYLCWCRRESLEKVEFDESEDSSDMTHSNNID